MKICFVAPANNYHTKKWANWFLSRGHEIHIISFIYDEVPGVTVHYIKTGASVEGSDTSKLKYLLHARELKKIVDAIKPDIVNVHYATSYGTVAALSGIKPYILSVWGMDIYDFPRKTPFHLAMLKYSLSKADCLFSTSNAMAKETQKYTRKRIEVTPFGVDMELFNPNKKTRAGNESKLVIGTVKGLDDKYGIGDILKAAALLRDMMPLEVRIAGRGPKEREYKKLAKDLKIDDSVVWLGFISQEEAAKEWANMDIALIPSTLESESFGVSAVEAQACGTPVVITDIPGLMEATKPGVTSVVIERSNAEQLARAIQQLSENKELREKMSMDGRQFVEQEYPLDKCFDRIEQLFIERVKK